MYINKTLLDSEEGAVALYAFFNNWCYDAGEDFLDYHSDITSVDGLLMYLIRLDELTAEEAEEIRKDKYVCSQSIFESEYLFPSGDSYCKEKTLNKIYQILADYITERNAGYKVVCTEMVNYTKLYVVDFVEDDCPYGGEDPLAYTLEVIKSRITANIELSEEEFEQYKKDYFEVKSHTCKECDEMSE